MAEQFNKIRIDDSSRPARDNKLPKVVIKDHQYNPVKESVIQNPHTSQDNQSKHPNISYSQPEQPQPVSPTGSCSSDSIILHYCR